MRLGKFTNTTKVRVVSGIVCWALLQGSALAQVPKALAIDDLLHLRRTRGPVPFAFSPDGKRLAYTVCKNAQDQPGGDDQFLRTGVPWNGVGCDLFLFVVDTRETRNLTDGHGSNWMPSWSPDGRYLGFLSDREGGQARFWVWDIRRGEIRQVSDIALRMGQPVEWTRDGRCVVVMSVPVQLSLEGYFSKVTYGDGKSERAVAGSEPRSTVLQYRSHAGSNAEGQAVRSDSLSLDEALRDLVLLEVASGQAKPLVSGRRISFFELSKNGSALAYSSPQRLLRAGSQQVLYNLGLVALTTGESKTVGCGIRLSFAARFSLSPDGLKLAYRTGGADTPRMELHVIDLPRGADRELAQFEIGGAGSSEVTNPMWPSSFTPLWTARGDELYCISGGRFWRTSISGDAPPEPRSIEGKKITKLVAASASLLWTIDEGRSTVVFTHDDNTKRDGLYKLDLRSGAATQLVEADVCYSCTEALEGKFGAGTGDGKLLAYLAEDAGHPADIWLRDLGFDQPRRLTQLNPDLDAYRMGSAKLIRWLDDDGKALRGALLLPAEYREGKRYPLILFVYGGALLSDSVNHFDGPMSDLPYYNLQLLATRGYAVLMPDAPQHADTPMLDLAKAILPGVNKVIEMGIADPERLGVMGQSYGGYSTLCLLVETNRFKAAAESDGAADLVGHYGQMEKDGTAFGTSVAETGQGLMEGTPWERRERYIENSPLFYLDRVETPLLIVHGAEDTTVSSFLGDQVFVALRRLGREVEYAKYEGEGHTLSSDANRRDVFERLIRWFDTHLKGSATEPASN